MATQGGGKAIEITVRATVDPSVSEDQVAEQIQAALSGLKAHSMGEGKLSIRTVKRDGVAAAGVAAGYESRLWEKATC